MILFWIIQGPLEEGGKKVRVREREAVTEAKIIKREKDLKMLCTTSFENGRRNHESRPPLEAGKCKGKDFP